MKTLHIEAHLIDDTGEIDQSWSMESAQYVLQLQTVQLHDWLDKVVEEAETAESKDKAS